MDQLLTAVQRYQLAEKAVNAYDGGIEGSTVEVEFHEAIEDIQDTGYEATTMAGALTGLRMALKETADFDGGGLVSHLLKGAMAYLDKLDTGNGDAFVSAAEMVEKLDLSGVEDNMWMAVYDGLTMAAHGLEGIMQRPQCAGRYDLNAGGKYLQAITDFLFEERRRAMEVLLARPLDMEKHIESMMRLQWLANDSNGEELTELKKAVNHISDLRDLYVERKFGKQEARS